MKAKVIILLAVLCVTFASCKKDKKINQQDVNPPENVLPDDVSDNIEQTLENLHTDVTKLNDINLPNGMKLLDFEQEFDSKWLESNVQYLSNEDKASIRSLKNKLKVNAEPSVPTGPQALKNALFARALIHATYLTTDSNFDSFLKSKNDNVQKSGLAYVYGSSDYTVQKAPSKGTCKEKLYGLDCSGMLTYIMNRAGLNISGKASVLNDTVTWQSALKMAGKDYEKITATSYKSSQIPLKDIQSGDMMFFYDKGEIVHIGVVLRNSAGALKLFQSNGSHSKQCEANYGSKRGPRAIDISEPITENWFSDYGILRLGADISGEYETYVRCTGESSDALQLTLSVPKKSGGAFTANGNGTDYDGSPITALLDGFYDAKGNSLNSTFTFSFPNNPSDGRKDSFSTILNFDDTGYIPMTKVVDNGGCDLSIRLINKDSKTNTTSTNNNRTIKPTSKNFIHKQSKISPPLMWFNL